MANFCRYCGKPLEEGEVCSCVAQQPQVQPQIQPQVQPQQQYAQPQQGYAQPVAGQAAPQAAGVDFKGLGMELLDWFKGFMAHPITAGSNFVATCNYKLALIMIGILSVSVGLFVAILLSKYNSIVKSISRGYYDPRVLAPAFTGFLGSAVVAFAVACALAGVVYLLALMFRGKTTYTRMLCVSAVKAMICVPYVLAAAILALLTPIYLVFIPAFIISFGTMLAEYVFIHVICAGSDVAVDKIPYILIINWIVMAIVSWLLISNIAVPMSLPPAVNNLGSFMEEFMGEFM